jgi:type IV fimbrial biogenesis protein FimT
MTVTRTVRGFTIIEMMVVVAIAGLLAVLAAPSFTALLDRQRVRGAVSNLNVDIQYARSEAVRKNAAVTVSFSPSTTPWCYGIVDGTATCDCTTPGSCDLKAVSGDDFRNVAMTLTPAVTWLGFTVDPRQGGVSDIGGGALPTTNAIGFSSSTTTAAQVQLQLNALGRIVQCSPGGTLTGFPAC